MPGHRVFIEFSIVSLHTASGRLGEDFDGFRMFFQYFCRQISFRVCKRVMSSTWEVWGGLGQMCDTVTASESRKTMKYDAC